MPVALRFRKLINILYEFINSLYTLLINNYRTVLKNLVEGWEGVNYALFFMCYSDI